MRFGDNCYHKLSDSSDTLENNAGACMDLENSVLWYPETVEELLFVKEKFPIASGEVYHMGVKNFSDHWGFTFADGTYSPGIPYYTCKF